MSKRGDVSTLNVIMVIVLILIVIAILTFAFRDKVKDLVSAGKCEDRFCTTGGAGDNCQNLQGDYVKSFTSCEVNDNEGKCCVLREG